MAMTSAHTHAHLRTRTPLVQLTYLSAVVRLGGLARDAAAGATDRTRQSLVLRARTTQLVAHRAAGFTIGCDTTTPPSGENHDGRLARFVISLGLAVARGPEEERACTGVRSFSASNEVCRFRECWFCVLAMVHLRYLPKPRESSSSFKDLGSSCVLVSEPFETRGVPRR